jgi:hypothetical protein
MKIRMKVDISGTRNGEPWPARGEVIDLPTDEAQSLIDSNMAEAITKAKAETAAVEPAEETAVLKRTTRARKTAPDAS